MFPFHDQPLPNRPKFGKPTNFYSRHNEKAKEECERLLNKCIKGGIISEIVKEYDSIKGDH